MATLADLIRQKEVVVLGVIRQELLSGIRAEPQFESVRTRLRGWRDEPIETNDWEEAARCSNSIRSSGIVGSPADCMICAIAFRRSFEIFTTDFDHYAKVLPIRLLPHPSP